MSIRIKVPVGQIATLCDAFDGDDGAQIVGRSATYDGVLNGTSHGEVSIRGELTDEQVQALELIAV